MIYNTCVVVLLVGLHGNGRVHPLQRLLDHHHRGRLVGGAEEARHAVVDWGGQVSDHTSP